MADDDNNHKGPTEKENESDNTETQEKLTVEPGTPAKPQKSPSKSLSKSPAKTPSNKDSSDDEEKESDEEMEESDEEELPPGLLERPLEVEGKRDKKKVERLSSATLVAAKEKEQLNIEEGNGVKLGDIPVVELNLQHTKATDCKPLHHILFLKHAKIIDVKRNIRKFSGEPHGKDSKEHIKRMVNLNKLIVAQLKNLCNILNLERGGSKQDLMDRLEEFILKPVDKGIKVGGKRKRSKTPVSKKSKKEKKEKKKKAKKEDHEEEEGEEEEEEEEEEESEDEAPKKKKVKLSPKKKSKSTPVKKDKKKSPSKKTPKQNGKKPKSPKKKKEDVSEMSDLSEDSDSEDEPLARLKEPTPPNNSEIKALVQKILKGADLETVTMKTVVKQVYAKYPKFDLTDRKDFIKDAVRRIIS